MIVVAQLAALGPARRALQIQPTEALKKGSEWLTPPAVSATPTP